MLPIVLLLLRPAPATAGDAANATDAGAVLRTRLPIAHGVAAFPSVVGTSDVAARINRGLEAAGDRLRDAVRACEHHADAAKLPFGWTRTVDVTANGPRLLSFLVQDDVLCGTTLPNSTRFALVYDLTTGDPVGWPDLLPPGLAVRSAQPAEPGGEPQETVTSRPLMALYRRLYPLQITGEGPSIRDLCLEAVGNPLTLWPDTASHALMVQPTEESHAVAVCAVPVGLTEATLRKAGATPPLLHALGAE